MKAIVKVELKPAVLDPQGRTIARSLAHMGFGEVKQARQGKIIELDLDEDYVSEHSQEEIHARVKEMCEQLLANKVIEIYHIDLVVD